MTIEKQIKDLASRIDRAATFMEAIINDPNHPIYSETDAPLHLIRVDERRLVYRYIAAEIRWRLKRIVNKTPQRKQVKLMPKDMRLILRAEERNVN